MGIRPSGLIVLDEGGVLGPVTELDGVGSGIAVSRAGTRGTLAVTLAGGGVDWAAMGFYRPQDYGTIDPTGAVDSATAFQAAADAMKNSNYGGVLLVPAGRFKIGTTIELGQPTYDANHGWGYQHSRGVVGAGRGATTLVAAAGMTTPILHCGGTTAGLPSVFIHDIAFNGNANTGMTPGVVKLNALAFSELRNVLVMGATGGTSLAPVGIYVEDCLTNVWDHVVVINADTLFKFTTGASPYTCNQTKLRDIVAAGSTAWAVDISSGANVVIDGIDIEGAGAIGSGAIRYSAGGEFEVRGPVWIEDPAADGSYTTLFDITASRARLRGPTIKNVTAATNVIQNRGATVLTVEDWHAGGTCVNAAGATLKKADSDLTGSGGTTTTLY